jgi:hypothetical protein
LSYSRRPEWGTPGRFFLEGHYWIVWPFEAADGSVSCTVAVAYKISQDEQFIDIEDLNYIHFE